MIFKTHTIPKDEQCRRIKTLILGVADCDESWAANRRVSEEASGKKKGTQTQTFGSGPLVGAGLPREGVGAKNFGVSLETHGKQTC